MWRFYIQYPDATYDQMDSATGLAWRACYAVWSGLTQSERDVVRLYYVMPYDKTTTLEQRIQAVADQVGKDIYVVKNILDDAIRAVALERGIADE